MYEELFKNSVRGVVYTPEHIANQLAQLIPATGTVMDACCGTGNLIMAIARHRKALGQSCEQIAKDLFACDINAEAVEICQERLIELLGHREIVCQQVTVKNFLNQ